MNRDLADAELWQYSSWRSHARRRAVSTGTGLDVALPSPRGLSLAALFAMTATPVAGLAAGFALAPGTAHAAKRVLKKGSKGARVKALQRALGITADGIYGPGTKRAVKRYQRRRGLVADGIAGPQTLRSLGVGRAASRGGARGGGGVTTLQRKLGIAADGVFGPGTEAAVKSFQRRRGMTADGIVGPATRSALGMRPGRVLKRGGAKGSAGSWTQRKVSAVIRAGNRIARAPYRYGGGHGSFRDSAYDCSGSVSYALHGAGLLRRPLDSSALMSYGRPGRGRHITIYANPGHVFMVVNGRRFDTSGQGRTGSRWQPNDRSASGYVVRHPAGL